VRYQTAPLPACAARFYGDRRPDERERRGEEPRLRGFFGFARRSKENGVLLDGRSSVVAAWEHMFVSTKRASHRCSVCREMKPASEFAWHRRALGKLDTYCRPCRAAYKRAHYLANRERYVAAATRRRNAVVAERTAFLFEFFRTHPCADCGETDPVILEFDHLGDKEFTIGAGIRMRNWQAVLDEMAKCEVVCANCHRRRTSLRAGFARAVAARAAVVPACEG
jgi:hypothetical protein